MANIIIDERLLVINLDIQSKEEGIEFLSNVMDKMGFVKEGFKENVLEREKQYPTGLPSKIPLAICHTEAKFVKHNAIAVATLKNPVEFNEMGNSDHKINAEIIFLLALNDPKTQVLWLRKLANIFQDEKSLTMIRESPTIQELAANLKKLLQV